MGKDKENACRHTSVSTVAPASLVGVVERSGSRLHTMAWSRRRGESGSLPERASPFPTPHRSPAG